MMSFIFEYGASLFDSILCVYFITRFNCRDFGFKSNPYWLPAIVIIFGYTIFSDKVLPGYNTLSTFLFLALYIIYALLVSQKRYIRALLSAFIFEVMLVLLSSLIYMGVSLLIDDFGAVIQGADNHVRNLSLVLHKVSLFAVCKLLLFIFRADDTLDLKSGLLTFGFSLISITGIASSMYISSLSHDGTVQMLVLVITIAFIAMNVFLYVFISQLLKLQRNKYRVQLLEEKLAYERMRYNESANVWENIRKVRHDIRQHLTIMKCHLENKEYVECDTYLQKLLPAVEQTGGIVKSDNKILDYMINSKLGSLKNTEIIISGIIGDLSDVDELDLACLIGNILDNAVEAVEQAEEKRIELLFHCQNSNRVIICKNTVKASVLASNKTLQTTKKQKDAHGYGTTIVSQIVEKYHGIVDYFEEFGMFGVQVCIPMQK